MSDRSGVATTLNNISGVYDALGEKQKALDFYNQALPLDHGESKTINCVGWVERS